jgi:hypothetical protein
MSHDYNPRMKKMAKLKSFLPGYLVDWYRNSLAGDNPPVGEYFDFQDLTDLKSNKGEFGNLLYSHKGHIVSKWTHFIDIYEEILAPYKNISDSSQGSQSEQFRLLEIGIAKGGSLDVWKKYFGENSLIYGIDINPECAKINIPGVHVRIGSQIDFNFLSSVISEIGNPHIIIDDGSHHAEHLSKTFEYLWPSLRDGGMYIIEDTHTSYWKQYGGGYKNPNSIIEFIKDAVDSVHHHYTRRKMPSRTAFLQNSVASITFFDSIIVIRKQRTMPPRRISFGSTMNT